MTSFIPFFDRVVIQRDTSALEKKVTKAGLLLPDKTKDEYKASQGTLISCGDSCDDAVKQYVGKKVLFNRFAGDDLVLDGKEFLLCSDRDILGGLDDDATSQFE